MTRAEQETVIRWDEAEQVVHVWSASPRTWRRCARLGLTLTRETTTAGQVTGRFYRLDLGAFRWGVKSRRAGGSTTGLQKARLARGNPVLSKDSASRTMGGGLQDPPAPPSGPRAA
jgi:hypothetical protein